jgi:hypothetical protein
MEPSGPVQACNGIALPFYEEFELCVYVVKIYIWRRRPKYVCNTAIRKGLILTGIYM